MNPKRFNILVHSRLNFCQELLGTKEEEYSSGKDRLYNFKRAAAILNTTQEMALLGMWTKHIVSVIDMIEDPSKITSALLDDKISDMINYSLLAEACLVEKMEEIENASYGECPPLTDKDMKQWHEINKAEAASDEERFPLFDEDEEGW